MSAKKYTVLYQDGLSPITTWRFTGLGIGQATRRAAKLFRRRGLRKATWVKIVPVDSVIP